MRHHLSTATKIYILEDTLILLMILIILQIFTYTYNIILSDMIIQTVGLSIAVLLVFVTQFMFDIEDEYYELLLYTRISIVDEQIEQYYKEE